MDMEMVRGLAAEGNLTALSDLVQSAEFDVRFSTGGDLKAAMS
jgi:hypothetical protein